VKYWEQKEYYKIGRQKYLEAGDSELGNEFDDLGVVVNFNQFTELIVGLEPSQQTTELVVVAGVR